jgi:hypothetical protein
MKRTLAALLTACFLLTGCGGTPADAPAKGAAAKAPEKAAEAHDHDADHDHDEDDEHHHHTAPRGGTLVELGDHVGNVEFLLDKATGTLTAYALDAHAENPVRMKEAALSLQITVNGAAPATVTLAATANPLTGETVGDTSQFQATVDALKGAEKFSGVIPAMEYRGVQLPETRFDFPAAAE